MWEKTKLHTLRGTRHTRLVAAPALGDPRPHPPPLYRFSHPPELSPWSMDGSKGKLIFFFSSARKTRTSATPPVQVRICPECCGVYVLAHGGCRQPYRSSWKYQLQSDTIGELSPIFRHAVRLSIGIDAILSAGVSSSIRYCVLILQVIPHPVFRRGVNFRSITLPEL